MGVREGKVEKYLDTQIKRLGGGTRKWVCPGYDGVPDRIVFLGSRYRNSIIFVEVKTLDGEHSPEQIREHKRLREMGARVHTVYGRRDVDSLILELMK